MSGSDKPVVLIVEDNPTGIASLVGILGSACELVVAKSLAQARRCLAPAVDLVLLDLYLPDGKGIELLRQLKRDSEYQSVPVLCISGSDDTVDIAEAFSEGAIDYVLKPFNQTILSAKVSTFVDFKRKSDLLASQAMADPLTGIGNRRLFEQQLALEWRRAWRHGTPLGLALIDLDNFKAINDQLGHALGDTCLQRLARAMKTTFGRAGDVVARLGGDEFVAILPGASADNTVKAAQRLRRALHCEDDRGEEGTCPIFTISIGCHALVPDDTTQPPDLVEAADRQLYKAKGEGGRDCVRPEL